MMPKPSESIFARISSTYSSSAKRSRFCIRVAKLETGDIISILTIFQNHLFVL